MQRKSTKGRIKYNVPTEVISFRVPQIHAPIIHDFVHQFLQHHRTEFRRELKNGKEFSVLKVKPAQQDSMSLANSLINTIAKATSEARKAELSKGIYNNEKERIERGAYFKERRLAKKKTIDELSDKMGIPPFVLMGFESGKNDLTTDRLDCLSHLLGLRMVPVPF